MNDNFRFKKKQASISERGNENFSAVASSLARPFGGYFKAHHLKSDPGKYLRQGQFKAQKLYPRSSHLRAGQKHVALGQKGEMGLNVKNDCESNCLLVM